MLKPEEAQKRLKEFKTKDRQTERVAALPEPLRAWGYGLIGRQADGKEPRNWSKRGRIQEEAGSALTSAPDTDRLRVFEALFPTLAPHVEQGWQLLSHLPFQRDYEASPFRAPKRPDLLVAPRCNWIQVLGYTLSEYEQDIEWVAAWAPHIGQYQASALGTLLAGAIAGGGPEGEAVFQILLESGRNEHAIGSMGAHVTSALLSSPRPDGWEWVERLLLAAQRQEGLRQAVLESIDTAHPEAFTRMVRLIVQHDLHRFSSVVRAFDVWLGFGLDVEKAAAVKGLLNQMAAFLEDPSTIGPAFQNGDARTVYLALWSLAFRDAPAALEPAARVLQDPEADRRRAAALLLSQLGLPETRELLVPVLDDPDLGVAWIAFEQVTPRYHREEDKQDPAGRLWEPFVRLVERCPRKAPVIELPWAGRTLQPGPEAVAHELPSVLGKRSAKELLPYLPAMDANRRGRVVEKLAKLKKDPAVRRALLKLVGDASEWVRRQALEALTKHQVEADEAQGLEKLLTRKSDDLRRGVISLLLNQADAAALQSAERLLGAKDAMQRLAGLDLLRQMVGAKRSEPECRSAAAAYRAARAPSAAEEELLVALVGEERETPTLSNALGLMDAAQRTAPVAPQPTGAVLRTEASVALLKSLDQLIHRHRETEVTFRYGWQEDEDGPGEPETETELLGNIGWRFPDPAEERPLEKDRERLPLREFWEEWDASRPDSLRDADGRELFRALASLENLKKKTLKYEEVVSAVLHWLLRLHPPAGPGALDSLLDATEQSLAEIPESVVKKVPRHRYSWDLGWRDDEKYMAWVTLCRRHLAFHPEQWQREHHTRFWGLLRWIDEPGVPVVRSRPELDEALRAYEAGAATEADMLDLLLARQRSETDDDEDVLDEDRFGALQLLSGRKPDPRFAALQPLVERCRQRILEVEFGRGDLPTAASIPALSLRHAGGAEVLVRVLQALGKGKLVRGYIYGDQGRSAVFSHLLRATYPGPEDTPERFAELAQAAGIPEQRLIDAAFYTPQWAQHVERAVDWPLFSEAVWWIHAHTKDDQWSVDADVREAWAAQIAQRTPLSQDRLVEGAVDVEWFRRIYPALGPERWKRLDEGAKYSSSGSGHKRAQLFADAMLGRRQKEELVRNITEKRNQDSLRALGLLPLPEGEAGEREVLERYQVIQEFLRGSRQFGSQRQASEKLAVSIALENLARTAGYPDPVRLEWAMEAREIEDLAAGPVSVTAGEVTLTLSINEWGEPDLVVNKAGKPLKSVPAAVKKDPGILALQERKREVQRQSARMRLSLEGAMCRGEAFTARELVQLSEHPVLAPMLRNLVFVGEGLLGYPVEGGRALEDHAGRVRNVPASSRLRIAHPHDLFGTGEWDLWQKECFRRERIQPFKQVFRELYVLTASEKADPAHSSRYAGHQVQPNQSRALLGKRGWVSNPEEGDVRRTFFHENVTAWLTFDYGYTTPGEVEGLTIESIGFSRRGDWEPLPLDQVPPRVFSEVMRDVDLVVSIAHQGGVDPEATASTVDMRAALLRETCGLLKVDNVRLQDSHALVDGKLGTYSIHLGSAVVHRQPGGHLCIVPVHSQHRGRVFLPFADPDPKTAEVVSKVLLLARDHEIQDPTILQQIYAQA